jgi:hypothetical protein
MYAGKKPDKVDPNEEALARWTRCRLTGEPLNPPVVADALGALINKDAAVAALLDRDALLPEAMREHVTGLRSLIDVKLSPLKDDDGAAAAGAAGKAAAGPSSAAAAAAAAFGCPVTSTPMSGRFRFYLHKPSGVAISERALREAPRALVAEALSIELGEEEEEKRGKGNDPSAVLPPLAALQQQAAVGEGDFLPINPTGPELARLRAAVLARLAAERERKKDKKSKKDKKKDKREGEGEAGRKRPAGEGEAAAAAATKKLRVPEGATPAVYASIFAKPGGEPEVKETFCARAMSGR